MTRIFYIHSNILKICCYKTVKESIERNEKVIIITTRGCSWTFFKDNVEVYDFAKIFQGEDIERVPLHNFGAIKDYRRYRKYRIHLNDVVKKIVKGETFYFYLPSMAIDMTAAFAYNKFCLGYYYVDEGILAYTPNDILLLYQPNHLRNRIKTLLGLGEHYHYEVTSKFRGTLSISAESFLWNTDKEKIVNGVDDYITEVQHDIPCFDNVIIAGFFEEEYDIITKCIDYTVEQILKTNSASKIGLKLHPQALTYNCEKTNNIIKHISDKYKGVVSLINNDVTIEVMSLMYKPTLFSLLELSSIIMYAILLKSSKTNLIDYQDGEIFIKRISSMQEYMEVFRESLKK